MFQGPEELLDLAEEAWEPVANGNAPLCESNDLIEDQGAIQLSDDSFDKATKPWENRERSPADAADFCKV
jgi:hypothetical protein